MSNVDDDIDKIFERVYLFGMNGGLGYEKFENELSPKEAKQAITALLEQAKIDILNKAHRVNGKNDYDNETDEYIDELLEEIEEDLSNDGYIQKCRDKTTKLNIKLPENLEGCTDDE